MVAVLLAALLGQVSLLAAYPVMRSETQGMRTLARYSFNIGEEEVSLRKRGQFVSSLEAASPSSRRKVSILPISKTSSLDHSNLTLSPRLSPRHPLKHAPSHSPRPSSPFKEVAKEEPSPERPKREAPSLLDRARQRYQSADEIIKHDDPIPTFHPLLQAREVLKTAGSRFQRLYQQVSASRQARASSWSLLGTLGPSFADLGIDTLSSSIDLAGKDISSKVEKLNRSFTAARHATIGTAYTAAHYADKAVKCVEKACRSIGQSVLSHGKRFPTLIKAKLVAKDGTPPPNDRISLVP